MNPKKVQEVLDKININLGICFAAQEAKGLIHPDSLVETLEHWKDLLKEALEEDSQ